MLIGIQKERLTNLYEGNFLLVKVRLKEKLKTIQFREQEL